MQYLEHIYGWLHTLCTWHAVIPSGGCTSVESTLYSFCLWSMMAEGMVHLGTKLNPGMICKVRDDNRQCSAAPGGKVNNVEILDEAC